MKGRHAMSDKIEIEFFVAINQDGEYGVSTDIDSVCDDLSVGATRIVSFKLMIAPPKISETKIDIPDETSGEPSVTINA
jgi:hypothetical protein